MTPETAYCFVSPHGKIVAMTGNKAEANGWMSHWKAGDTVATYKLEKAETKRRGDK